MAKHKRSTGEKIVEAERRTLNGLKGDPGLPPRQPSHDVPADAESVKPREKRNDDDKGN